ncbi:uncharacterized protein LOC134193474 [Corticium candelabrum]|uniref:uncharacterized protein LOC134193474 n=1 Tax=Corticium candelabrum TaxID=121492 RepID=UPI002E26FA1E|nr:uncharacterized protein LOC134193474 [Corticium candelabrum]
MSCVALCISVSEAARVLRDVKIVRVSGDWSLRDMLQELIGLSLRAMAGAIDGSHIPITPPVLNHTDYYNRKGWYSVILQAVVDHHQYLFCDINVGWPRNKAEGTILNGQSKQIEGCTIPVFLIGDSAYPLLKWLIKPYPENDHMTEQRRNFNYQLSRARIVVENAFGCLKARWRRLMKKNDMSVKMSLTL